MKRFDRSDAEDHKAWAAKLINFKALCDSSIAKQVEAVWRMVERMAVCTIYPKWVLQPQKSAPVFL